MIVQPRRLPDELIAERGNTHGDYADTARIAQALKTVMHGERSWQHMSDKQRESLDMIATKLSRILSGDPSTPDHWQDISGYALLPLR